MDDNTNRETAMRTALASYSSEDAVELDMERYDDMRRFWSEGTDLSDFIGEHYTSSSASSDKWISFSEYVL